MTTLYMPDNAGGFRTCADIDVIKAGEAAIRRKLVRGLVLAKPSALREHLPALLGGRDYEVFCVAHIDNAGGLIAFEEMFRGTIDKVSTYVRDICKRALELNAAYVVVVHNHPSGGTEASLGDIAINAKLYAALGIFEIPLADHFIVGGAGTGSLREQGAFEPAKMMQALERVGNGESSHGAG